MGKFVSKNKIKDIFQYHLRMTRYEGKKFVLSIHKYHSSVEYPKFIMAYL